MSFSTNVCIIGGSYSGLSALNYFINNYKTKSTDSTPQVSVTLVEPRAGFLNVLGISRCSIDLEFAETQYIPFEKVVKFHKVISNNIDDPEILCDSKVSVTFVHGQVNYLDEYKLEYELSPGAEMKPEQNGIIEFDYVIMASGRTRNWPTTPLAYTFDKYLDEMKVCVSKIDANKIITIIGAGAVGIEIAGDFKHYRPDKTIQLIHPYSDLPPEEALNPEFKRLALESLRNSGVEVMLNTRVKAAKSIDYGTTEGDLETIDGRVIKSDLNIWAIAHKNNTCFLAKHLKDKFVTEHNNIKINEYLQLSSDGEVVKNFFALGDLVELPIVKSAGWAMYHGRQVANNLSSLLIEDKFVEPGPDPNSVPKGMVLVAGNGELICELSGVVSKNVPEYVAEYKDYCVGKIEATLGLGF